MWKLRTGLYLISLTGALATSLSRVGAQAYLLSRYPPQFLIVHLVVAGILLWAVARWSGRNRRAFGFGAVLFCALGAWTFHRLQVSSGKDPILDNLMVLFALFFVEYFSWMLVEAIHRYVHPMRAPQVLARTFSFFEIGTIAALASVGLFPSTFDLAFQLKLSSIAALVLVFGFLFWFAHPMIKPVQFDRSESRSLIPQGLTPYVRKILLGIFLAGGLLGSAKVLSEYLAAFILKSSNGGPATLSYKLSLIYLAGSVLTLAGHLIDIGVERNSHKAPKFWLNFGTLISGAGVAAAFFAPPLAAAVLVGSVFRGAFKGPLNFGLEIYLTAFGGALRQRMKQAFNLAFYLIRVVMLLLPLLLILVPEKLYLQLVLALELTLIIGAGLVWPRLNRNWSFLTWKFLRDGDKTSQILAASQFVRLGFRRPVRVFQRLIGQRPKTVLRKTLIESLGYHSTIDRHAVSMALIQQFHATDKEEVQIAVLGTMLRQETPWNIRFFQEIALGRDRTIRSRVRQECVKNLYRLYGDRAVAFCLDGFAESDPKVVAESLMTLTQFRHFGMLPEIQKRAREADPYIRSAAFYALTQEGSTRHQGLDGLKSMLESESSLALYLALEKILRLRNIRSFLPTFDRIYAGEHSRIAKIGLLLGQAFIRDKQRKGYELFGRMLLRLSANQRSMAGFHHFSMLEPEDRIEVIAQIHRLSELEQSDLAEFARNLKESGYDFHWELDVLRDLCRRKPAQAFGAFMGRVLHPQLRK